MTRDLLRLSILDTNDRITLLTSLICLQIFQQTTKNDDLRGLITQQQQHYAKLRTLLLDYGVTITIIDQFDKCIHDLNLGYLLHEVNVSVAKTD